MKPIASFNPGGSAVLPRLRALSHHVTWFLGRKFSRTFPFVFVIGYPKSGTTWVSQLIADYLQLPFAQHSLLPVGCPAVVHGHERASKKYPRGLYVMRDGRDALTSMYFFNTRRLSEGDNPAMSRRLRRKLPGLVNREDVARNIGPFVETQMKRPLLGVHWGRHVRSFYDAGNQNLILIRFEDLRAAGPATLAAAIQSLTSAEPDMTQIHASLERFSFERQTGRKPGEVDRESFLRKGQSGDWQNHFTVEAAETFDHYCGDMLVRAGYEADRDWVQRFKARRAP
jgi:hypothetical protein